MIEQLRNREVFKAPEHSKNTMFDYLEPFDRWATTLNAFGSPRVTRQALYNSRELAKGRLNLVIVLIEPCNSHHMDYEQMFYRSDTLREIDRLIRAFTSRFTYRDITILDVRPLVSENMRKSLDMLGIRCWEDKAHNVFEEILLLKRPDVILALQCQTRDAKSPITRSLCGYMPANPRPSIIQLQDHQALVFRGFHPSAYLRDDYTEKLHQLEVNTRKESLHGCFRSAFLALRGERLVRWNNYMPWYWMCSMIAKEQGLSKEDGKDMPPDHLFRSIKLHQVPETQSALIREKCIHMKLEHLAKLYHGYMYQPVNKTSTQPACEKDVMTWELINGINALSIG
ncbi:hypothetical protein GQ44DRAFT_512462 [Phaeosphaeriaceae sp. PMI808]|nr:hypothetical protein GQ44DRAFT_512462 [Phaeosphaeriaceae sp. PMI808]